MKGILFYEKSEAIRNKGFIDELMKEANRKSIELQLAHEEVEIPTEADFILFRDRNVDVAKQLEADKYRLFNRAEVNAIANDKLKTIQMVSLLGIQTIPTKIFNELNDINEFPSVLKTADGHGGSEVELCQNIQEAELFMERYANQKVIAQPYIESSATDVRVFVIGEKIVGAVKRIGLNSFKSNFTLGGRVEKYPLSPYQRDEVLKIARAIKSDYIGIDFLLLSDGQWLLNEIEDPVGARSFYQTHEENIAELLIDHIKKKLSD